MDQIRKKMQSLKYETDGMLEETAKLEEITREAEERNNRCECDIRDYSKKIQKLEGSYEETFEQLQKATVSLEENNVLFKDKEEEIAALQRRLQLLEGELSSADLKLAKTTMDLGLECKRADKIIKVVNGLNSRAMNTEMEIEELSKSEKEAKFMLTESEKTLDEISRRHGVIEEELRRTEEKADLTQKKVDGLDEELKVVGENMKALEVSEEKANARDEKFKEQINVLMERIAIADGRAEYGDMNIALLNQRIDNIEDEIIRSKIKTDHVGGEMNETFIDILHKY